MSNLLPDYVSLGGLQWTTLWGLCLQSCFDYNRQSSRRGLEPVWSGSANCVVAVAADGFKVRIHLHAMCHRVSFNCHATFFFNSVSVVFFTLAETVYVVVVALVHKAGCRLSVWSFILVLLVAPCQFCFVLPLAVVGKNNRVSIINDHRCQSSHM